MVTFVGNGLISLRTSAFLSSRSCDGRSSRCLSRSSRVGCRRKRSRQFLMITDEALGPKTAESLYQSETRRYYETFQWRGHRINYFVAGPADGAPVLLVHGFGASVNHWRRTIPALLQTGKLRVYAVDLLGFGASDKPSPAGTTYCLELWRDLVVDFANHFGRARRWAFCGNSIGSLVCIMATDALGEGRVRGCSLMNCAGGLTSFRKEELSPVGRVALRIFNAVLFNPVVGGYIFRNIRNPDTLGPVLKNVYGNQDAVDSNLVEIISAPAFDDGACDVFLAVFNADSGPKPSDILPRIQWCPILVCWGLDDAFTPYATGMSPGDRYTAYHRQMTVETIEGCGHCPHDDRPAEVNSSLIPFLLGLGP